MNIKYYHINAFTKQLFHGNPAAVCPLNNWLDDDILLEIAAENNQPVTAFMIPRGNDYHLRWFTPFRELELCGHATMAASFVALNQLNPGREYVTFQSASGPLHAAKHGDTIALNFPAMHFTSCEAPENLLKALNVTPQAVYSAHIYMVVLDSEKMVRDLNPDLVLLKTLDLRAVAVTAKGEHVDFVSRYFSPKTNLNEDPVTGSAHCLLAPYWSELLGRNKLKAQQLSKRGGEILCEVKGDRVLLTGHAKLYMHGMIELST